MSGPRPPLLLLSTLEREALEALARRPTTSQQLALRARILLAAAAGENNAQIARRLATTDEVAARWRQRWRSFPEPAASAGEVVGRLTDLPRPGTPARITAEQWCQITALACEVPKDSQRPLSHWTPRELAAEAIQRGIIDRLSPRHLGRFLKGDRPAAASQSLLAPPPAQRAARRAGRPDPRDL